MAYSRDVTYRRMKAKLQKDLKKVPSNLTNRKNHIKAQIKRLDDAFKARTKKLMAGGKKPVSRRDRPPLVASKARTGPPPGTTPPLRKDPAYGRKKVSDTEARKMLNASAAKKKANTYAQGLKTAKADAQARAAKASARRAAAERKRLGGLHRVPTRRGATTITPSRRRNPHALAPVPTRRGATTITPSRRRTPTPAPKPKPKPKPKPAKKPAKKAPKTARQRVKKQLKKVRKKHEKNRTKAQYSHPDDSVKRKVIRKAGPKLQAKRDKDGKLTARGRLEKLYKRRGYINKRK